MSRNEALQHLRQTDRQLEGFVAIQYNTLGKAGRVFEQKHLSPLVPTKWFLELLSTLELQDDSEIHITWEISSRTQISLRFKYRHLMSNLQAGAAVLKTQYTELFIFYPGHVDEIQLDECGAEFIVFDDTLERIPPALYAAASVISNDAA